MTTQIGDRDRHGSGQALEWIEAPLQPRLGVAPIVAVGVQIVDVCISLVRVERRPGDALDRSVDVVLCSAARRSSSGAGRLELRSWLGSTPAYFLPAQQTHHAGP